MRKYITIVPILFIITVLFIFAATRLNCDLGNTDEGIYITVAGELIENNTWFKTTYFNNPYYNKLPFAIWPYKIGLMFFDYKDIGFRGVQLLIGLLCAISVFIISKKLTKNYLIASLSVLLLLTLKSFFIFLTKIKMDTLLLFFQIGGLYFLYCWYEKYKNKDLKNAFIYPFLFAISIALAFLTKTLMMVLVPAIFFFFLLVTNNLRFITNQKKQIIFSILVFFIITAVFFFFYISKDNYNSIINSLFVTEIKTRALTGYHNKKQDFFYFNRILKGQLLFPIFIFFSTVFYMLYLGLKRQKDEIKFLITWGITPILIMSLAKSKLEWYVLLSCPAFSIMVSILLFDIFSNFLTKLHNKRFTLSFYCLALLSSLMCLFLYNQLAFALNSYAVVFNHPLKNFIYEMKKDENKDKKICIFNKDTIKGRKGEFFKFYSSQAKSNIIEIKKQDLKNALREQRCDYYILPYNEIKKTIIGEIASFIALPRINNSKAGQVILSFNKEDKLFPSLEDNKSSDSDIFTSLKNNQRLELPITLVNNESIEIVGKEAKTSSCIMQIDFENKLSNRFESFLLNGNIIKVDFFMKNSTKSTLPFRSIFFLEQIDSGKKIQLSVPEHSESKIKVNFKCHVPKQDYLDKLIATENVIQRSRLTKKLNPKKFFISFNEKRIL